MNCSKLKSYYKCLIPEHIAILCFLKYLCFIKYYNEIIGKMRYLNTEKPIFETLIFKTWIFKTLTVKKQTVRKSIVRQFSHINPQVICGIFN